jgi:undecaprenyl diphosphate synthase
MSDLINIPRHVGYIVDGNRRWAKERGLAPYEGHVAGYKVVHEVIKATFEAGVEFVSAYIFSTENWKRDQDEINKILNLFFQLLNDDISILNENNIKFKVLGSRMGLSSELIKAIDDAEKSTAKNSRGTFALCFNYGGQLEIVEAVQNIIKEGSAADDIDVDFISKHIYVPEVPPIDIVVRTSGEKRLSNFMLWRSAYSEIMFLDKMWPDMTKSDVTDIINEYSNRSRRFGG